MTINEVKEMIIKNIDGDININNVAGAICKINDNFNQADVIEDLTTAQSTMEKVMGIYNKKYESSADMIEKEMLSELATAEQKAGYLETLHSMLNTAPKSAEDVSDFALKSLEDKKQIVCKEIAELSKVFANGVVSEMNFDINAGANQITQEDMLISSAAMYYLAQTGDIEAKYPEMIGMAVAGNAIVGNEATKALGEAEKKEMIKEIIIDVIEGLCVIALCCFVGWLVVKYGIIGTLVLFAGEALCAVELLTVLYMLGICAGVLFALVAIMLSTCGEAYEDIQERVDQWKAKIKAKLNKGSVAVDATNDETEVDDDKEDNFENNGKFFPANI